MGIRNSFGIDFDPLTGNLWDTENGPTSGDEINLVFPGFNSGWLLFQGFSGDNLLGTGASSSDLVFLVVENMLSINLHGISLLVLLL